MFAGIDSHKDTLAVAVIDAAGRTVTVRQIANEPDGFTVLADLVTAHEVVRVGIEGSTNFGWAAAMQALAAGEQDAFELMLAVRPYAVRGQFTPDVALLEIAATALELACPPGSQPLEYQGLTDRYLSDLMLSDRRVRYRTRYAVYAAACMREGLVPDLLNEAGGWEPRLWTYAVPAVVLYIRAAAERLALSVPETAVKIADELALQLTVGEQRSH